MFCGRRRHLRQKLLALYGSNPLDAQTAEQTREDMDQIRVYYDESQSNPYVDEITWDDLEMDEIFLRINQTKSYVGEQVLYKRLHEADASCDWEQWETIIEACDADVDKRLALEEQLVGIGKRDEDYYMPVFLRDLDALKIPCGFLYHILQAALLITGFAGVFTQKSIWLCACLGIAVVNLAFYTLTKQKYESFLYSLGSIKQIVRFCEVIGKDRDWSHLIDTTRLADDTKYFKWFSRLVGSFQVRKHSLAAWNELSFLQDYVLGISLYDISMYNHLLRILKRHVDKVWHLYEFVGSMDMAISVASFRRSKRKVCIPEFCPDGGIDMRGVCHPLLEDAVVNDFSLEKPAMITGANASGKSTFMKAVAINVILAQTIHTCTAKAFHLPAISVMSSMALRDDIVSGESYYVREVRYLKRMLDALCDGKQYLFVIDEIFKGTNTRERVAASFAMLRYLQNRNCQVIVATHDIELAEELTEGYTCYYFDSHMEQTDIRFDYKLHRGIGGTTNAIDLLTCFGFPDTIVVYAKQALEHGPLIHEKRE